ncbi:trk system potassium uptake protein TrkA [Hydrogenoanaerobacterium saccharovorans]|uniref:Trk system potassium uptake protein TrkA n=1 Tax=Hydrogenoanaerobacterium saccharovorans TaxID=474960 RepID=A0A1H8AG54_9FIRM|nr:TrkA family potassium uptake protein [Hydrogenoanaerobacterium saccharovorans]RPF47959.1 trk system potassium uptake protein TrkA [Hydrogenoanaerobacterium saccharovorans]SEM69812.1 trk system potassium uptake protein TrkA [Hydrogenoanaerobacterium saccharovorans]
MTVIVVGGGKVGFYLARTLMEHGHKPRIIEESKETCARIANDLDIPIFCGDGSTIEALQNAGIEEADALISVTGKDENNLIACQLAKKEFHVKRTVARVNNPKNMSIMKQLGVDIPISSTDNIARLLEREVDTSAIKQIMSLNRGETSISEFEIPQNYKRDGIRLSELRMPEESIIVSISRDGTMIIPRGNTQIFSGDKVIVICQLKVIHDLSRMLGLE